jgi:hypothetical protein
MATATAGNLILNAYLEDLAPGGPTNLLTSQAFGSTHTTTTAVPASAGTLFTVTISGLGTTSVGNHVRVKLQRSSGDTAPGDLDVLAVSIIEPGITSLDLSGYTSLKLGSAATPLTFPSTNGTVGQVLQNNGSGGLSWTNLSGSGVSSVGLSMPSDYTVSGSPVTSTGTITVTHSNQSAHTVFAGPVSGSPGAPTWRSLDTSDITTGQLATARGGTGLDTSNAAVGELLIGTGLGLALSTLTAGSNVSITNGTGTITIDATGISSLTMPSDFAVSGTTSLTVSYANQSANKVLAGPASGSASTPSYRSLVPADLPTMVASGASHAGGAVPDPGSTAGTSRYLCEDGTWSEPSGGGGGSGTTANASGSSYTTLTTDTLVLCSHSGGQSVTLTTSGVSTGHQWLVQDAWGGGRSGSPITVILDTSAPINGNIGGSYNISTDYGSALFVMDASGGVDVAPQPIAGTVPITSGGTGQTTASGAINALLPSQTGNSGKYLTTNGSSASWGSVSGGGSGITVNSTSITSGTSGRILYDNSGVVGELATVDAAHGGTGVNGGSASNGSLLIGNGSGYTLSTLTAGTGITVTNSAGGITIAASGSTSYTGANGIDVTGTVISKKALVTQSAGTTATLDFSNSDMQKVTLTGNISFTLSNLTNGQTFMLVLTQDALGSHTVSWWSGISWQGGSPPTLTSTANKTDIFEFIALNSSTFYGKVWGQNL